MTLAELRATIRVLLTSPDAAQWPDSDLDLLIAEAIRRYSARFPRRLRDILTLTTGTQAYALPGGRNFQGILSVAYPAADDPPPFLRETNECSAEFQAEDYVYAIRGVTDTTTAALDTTAGMIVFAQEVTTGETAAIEYLAAHSQPAVGVDTDNITVPSAHMGAIIAGVEYFALAKLANDAAKNDHLGDASWVAELKVSVRDAWQRWQDTLNGLSPIVAAGGPTIRSSVTTGWAGYGL